MVALVQSSPGVSSGSISAHLSPESSEFAVAPGSGAEAGSLSGRETRAYKALANSMFRSPVMAAKQEAMQKLKPGDEDNE
jgi:hypothetical protein